MLTMLERLMLSFLVLTLTCFGLSIVFAPPSAGLKIVLLICCGAFIVCALVDLWTT